ncbi:ANL_collapsed_G0017090.mRNA.1.CDS.1 [Saccharomyces cerevisiae]|nr:BEM_HP_G0007940.mRNA.1.CDS.1 [Saccharomyces cerevisiae]CAI5085478.1 BEM_HP_G0057900.mRNA.1.CDS.1 [Saccharomyces cerevisiae]CAI5107980.1 BEM_HP_G0065330.mRNA.1.CDS.1 [Saccharomyces cerevisiae]CAI5158876.1 BEM_HP_G0082180.mRNA.1.CDS.1 [Saccharomyces cerevisiae]CAI5219953.1 ANM_HP_G0035740.mRNA.1.CDS.1 [Saccharomyces cerevisiae]
MICCLTSPIIRNWGLAQAAGVSYGTFGYCKTLNSFSCSRVRLIYNTSKEKLPGPSLERWWLSPKARHTIGGLLISIPVATCLTFISFALPLVIIFLFQTGGTNVSLITSNAILHILTLLSTIFACTVVLLQFHPYTTWCGWLTLPCSLCSLLACIFSVLGLIRLRSQTENIAKEASIENVDSILKLYGTSQTSSSLGENYPQTTKGTDQSVYDITSLFNDLPRTLDPNQDKLAVTNQDEPPPEIKSPLKQAGLVSFFAPKLNGKQIFSRRHVENQKSLSLDEINITDLPAKQKNVEMPTEKKKWQIFYIMRESQAIHKITTTLLGYLALRLPNQPIALKYIQKKIIVSQSPANINYNNQIITRIKVRFLITLSFLGIPEEDQ